MPGGLFYGEELSPFMLRFMRTQKALRHHSRRAYQRSLFIQLDGGSELLVLAARF